jgi:archaellum component FlaF (FlaF/FlaG flagellin family)
MGLSAPLALIILLLGFLVSAGLIAGALIHSAIAMNAAFDEYLERERGMIEATLDLEVEKVGARVINVTVRSTGSRTIFLRSGEGYRWNSVIVAYQHGSYLVEDYRVLEVRVSGTNKTFDPDEHPYISPGEEALIAVELPDGAPDISIGDVVLVVFASHYGTTAADEGVRDR